MSTQNHNGYAFWGRLFVWGAIASFVCILAAFALEIAMMLQANVPHKDAVVLLVTRLPAVAYLVAIAVGGFVMQRLSKGEPFGREVVHLLRVIGIALVCGGLLRVFGTVLFLRIFAGLEGSIAYFDPSAITIGVLGGMLIILSRVASDALQLRSELKEIV